MDVLIVGLSFAFPGSGGLGATLDVDADDVGTGGFVETGICDTRDALGDAFSAPTAPMVRAVPEDAS